MNIFKWTRTALLTAIAVSVLALGAAPFSTGSASAQNADYVSYLENLRLEFLGADDQQVLLKSSNVCGGSGCAILKVVDSSMSPAKSAVQTQGAGQDIDEMIESFSPPETIKSDIRNAVNQDSSGNGDGPNMITVPIGDEFDFVALLRMLDFAIEAAKGN